MPLTDLKFVEGVLDGEQKQQIVERRTGALVSIEDESPRSVTWCVLEEVESGDFGIAGNGITAEAALALAAGVA